MSWRHLPFMLCCMVPCHLLTMLSLFSCTCSLAPFFNDIVGIMGSLGFWPLTVFLPVRRLSAGCLQHSWACNRSALLWLAACLLSMMLGCTCQMHSWLRSVLQLLLRIQLRGAALDQVLLGAD